MTKLKKYLTDKNITSIHVEKGTGIPCSFIRKYQNGNCMPDIKIAIKISKFLDCKISDIF